MQCIGHYNIFIYLYCTFIKTDSIIYLNNLSKKSKNAVFGITTD